MKPGDRVFSELHKAKILVVGDVMLDRYWYGEVNRISPEAPVPIVRVEATSRAAGSRSCSRRRASTPTCTATPKSPRR
jgi:bifunctional ADP-heptose synthase (sugar kinase/adenylyltransferase)